VQALKNAKPNILVIGDLMIDHYLWGSAERISPEAPVQVVDIAKESSVLGGAGNVINNLISLGATVNVASVVGDDEIAKELVLAGADPFKIAMYCFDSKPVSKLKLLGLAIETIEVFYEGRLSVMLLTPDMFSICNSSESETDDFVSYARSIDTVEIAALIKEFKPGRISVSLRSKRYVNVADLAGRFGGGGHFNAAGFKTTGAAQDIKKEVVAAVGEYLDVEGP